MTNKQKHNGKLTVVEAGKRGGTITRQRKGTKFFRDIGRKGGEVTKRRWGTFFKEWGKKGGRPGRPRLS